MPETRTVLFVLLSIQTIFVQLVVSKGVDVGLCQPKIINCQCGKDVNDGKGVIFQVKEDECTFFHRWKPSCKSCKERSDEQVCETFRYCHQCDSADSCFSCPPGRYGTWCHLECQCQNGGTCDNQGNCACQANFAGNKCEVSVAAAGVCPKPPAILDHGSWTLIGDQGTNNLVTPGATIVYNCESNDYTLQGESTLTCRHDGTWSANSPTCVEKTKSCPQIAPVNGAKVTIHTPGPESSTIIKSDEQAANLPLGPFQSGTQLIYTCESKFYSLEGSSNRTCQPDGTWTGTSTLCLTKCGRASGPRASLVLGGEPSKVGQWPWQAGLAYNMDGEWVIVCGGSVIHERWIVTAAHCVTIALSTTKLPPDMFRVYLGKHYRDDSKDDDQVLVKNVERFEVHPDYRPDILDMDIALIRITTIEFTNRIQPVCLPDPNKDGFEPRLYKGNKGIVSGWGKTEHNNLSSELRFVEVSLVPFQECRDEYNKFNVSVVVTRNALCAGNEKGEQDSCKGDSGGPLVFPVDSRVRDRWVLEGVVSWGSPNGCGLEKQYSGFVKVQNFVDWITAFFD